LLAGGFYEKLWQEQRFFVKIKSVKRKTLLLWAFGAFLCGVFVMDIFRTKEVLFGGFLFWGLAFFPSLPLRAIFLWALCFVLGGLRLLLGIETLEAPHIAALFTGEKTEQYTVVEGVIERFPEEQTDKTRIFVRTEKILEGEQEAPTFGTVLVNLPAGVFLEYGDRVRISGVLKKPFISEVFNYQRYLEKEGVYAYFARAKATVIPRDDFSTREQFWKMIFTFRKNFEDRLHAQLPSPEGSYAIGIILGAEYGIPDSIIQEFNITGLRHLLALSGFNITILIIAVFWCLRIFPKKIAVCSAITLIFLFVILTGASASVVRAAVMGILAMVILHSGRRIPFYLLLAMSLSGMVFWNPFLLVSDASLQLSVLSLIGLYSLSPLLEQWASEKIFPNIFGIREALLATVSAQIMTMPMVLALFERFSLIAPLSNLFVAPLTSIAMLFSALVTLPFLGTLFVPFAWVILSFSLFLAHIFSLIPGAQANWSLPLPFAGIITILLFFFAEYGRKKLLSSGFRQKTETK